MSDYASLPEVREAALRRELDALERQPYPADRQAIKDRRVAEIREALGEPVAKPRRERAVQEG